MYFPYIRGRQYELLALYELSKNKLLGNYVIPIIEPVKLSSTLIKTIEEYVKSKHQVAIIRNPLVGSFLKELNNVKKESKEYTYKKEFTELASNSVIIQSATMQKNTKDLLNVFDKNKISKKDLLIINTNREFIDTYDEEFCFETPRYTIIPDESAFRRRIKKHRVIIDDKFEKQSRNADYRQNEEEFFSDDHLYFKDDGSEGFSDYSIIGNDYQEGGFAPYAVAIHIVYFDENKALRIKHFVSDSNEDISNPAKKFNQAVSKLKKWYEKHPEQSTYGLKALLEHCNNLTYPGLGSVKKLSIMHHLELMGKYLMGDINNK